MKVNNLIALWEIKYAEVDFSQLEITTVDDNLTLIESPSIDFKDAPKGARGGVVLNVSKVLSTIGKMNNFLVPSKVLPVFVGVDIAGAIIDACVSGVGSYVTASDFNWKSVAWGAASSAIVGSTGIVGKVGKWISKLF